MDLYRDLGSIADATGLGRAERAMVGDLADELHAHSSKNRLKRRYYDGRVTVAECNLGIALPPSVGGLEMACAWPEKAVTVLKDRSRFDAFVTRDGGSSPLLDRIVRDNSLVSQYGRACGDELMHGVVFATFSAKKGGSGVAIRFHSAETATAIWDGGAQRIGCGLAIMATGRRRDGSRVPTQVNLYTDSAVWVISRDADRNDWRAVEFPHAMGRPLMLAMSSESDTIARPFGRSRITPSVRNLTQGYIRTMALATIALEFSTSPQKYLLGLSDEQYDALINQKFKTYIGSMLLTTTDENGNAPKFGQVAQGSIQPHVDMLRMLSTQFAAVTSLSVTDTGVVNDANPTSADAVGAANEKLIIRAQNLNRENGDALYQMALMAQAIATNSRPEDLTDEQLDVMPHFMNPAMPSQAAMADAAVKIASGDPEFAGTDVYYEMQGFDAPTIARIQAQKRRAAGRRFLEGLGDEGI